jgi:CysZ protein
VITAFAKAFAQLSDPRIRAVIWKSVAGTILVFISLLVSIGWTLGNTTFFQIGWVETAVDVLGGLATLGLALILFPGIVSAFASIFLEEIAEAFEKRHFPTLGPAKIVGWRALISSSCRLIGLTIVLNLMVLPFYLIPGLNLVIYFGLNGYLLGREYFEVVALRRLDHAEALALRQKHRSKIILTGAVTAGLLTIPLVNMIAPVLGTAAMVHLFNKLNGR